MQTQLKHLLLLTCFLSILACSENSKNNATVTDPDAKSSITGTISLTANLATDSDLNDPNSPYEDNSSFSTAQEIENFLTIQGFASKKSIQELEVDFEVNIEIEPNTGRFYTSADEYDYFKANLVKGQLIQLQTVSPMYSDADGTIAGDLDIFLFSSTYDFVDHSIELGEIDSITVPESGLYYIAVQANQGASKYVLSLSPGSSNQITSNTSKRFQNKPNLDFVPNELIIKFSEQSTSNSKSILQANMRTTHSGKDRPTLAKFSDTKAFASIKTNTKQSGILELASLNHKSYEKLRTVQKLKTVQAQSNVLSASLNFYRYPLLVPNDTLYNKQWNLPDMNLPAAWEVTTGTPSSGDVIVAVIDTGIYSNHPDLANKLVSGYDFISDAANSSDNEPGDVDPNSDIDNNPEDPGDSNEISSSSWHGTHVAGIIAAETNNNYGIAGVSWGAQIMPIRVLGKENGTDYDIMQGVRFAAGLPNDSGTIPDKPADIINLSLGGPGFVPEEEALFSQIKDLGIIVVAAAGNENTIEPSYPASYDGVFSVSALDLESNITTYSNYGSHIDIAAPGGDTFQDLNQDDEIDGVLSTLVSDDNGSKSAGFEYYEGTSMASPHVAGMFALMKAVYPALNSSTAEKLLKTGALTKDFGDPVGRDDYYGYGAANALKAVQSALNIQNGSASIPVVEFDMKATPTFLSLSGSTVSEVLITNEGTLQAQIASTSSDASWLRAIEIDDSAEEGDAELDDPLDIPKRFSIITDTSALDIGSYTGTVTFSFSSKVSSITIPPLNVYVTMDLIESEYVSNVAEMKVRLYQQDTLELVNQTAATIDPNGIFGQLKFSLDNVKAGGYYLSAGTDIDNDNEICQEGEACAKYPTLNTPELITIGFDTTTNVELDAELLYSLDTTVNPSQVVK